MWTPSTLLEAMLEGTQTTTFGKNLSLNDSVLGDFARRLNERKSVILRGGGNCTVNTLEVLTLAEHSFVHLFSLFRSESKLRIRGESRYHAQPYINSILEMYSCTLRLRIGEQVPWCEGTRASC